MEWGIIVYSTSCRRVRSPGHVYGGKTFLKARLLPNIITLPCKSMELHGCSRQAHHNVLDNIPSHIHINIPPALYQNLFHGFFFLVVILIFQSSPDHLKSFRSRSLSLWYSLSTDLPSLPEGLTASP